MTVIRAWWPLAQVLVGQRLAGVGGGWKTTPAGSGVKSIMAGTGGGARGDRADGASAEGIPWYTVLVLAIDTSTPAVTAGLATLAGADVSVLAERVTVNPRAHGELITPHILDAAKDAGVTLRQVDAIVCGVGPGPFTGLRAGMATAAALAHGLGINVYPVCSLDAIAAAADADAEAAVAANPAADADAVANPDAAAAGAADANARASANAGAGANAGANAAAVGEPFLVVTDARRREVYWAAYDASGARTDGPHVQSPEPLGLAVAAGDGARLYAEKLGVRVLEPYYPTVAGLVTAAQPAFGAEPAPLTPLYLRRPDAVEPSARKRVTA